MNEDNTKVYCDRSCAYQKDGVCQKDAIAISEDGCMDYTMPDDEINFLHR